MTWPILLKKTDHAGAARSSIEPRGQRSSCRVCPCLEEPEPHIHIGTNGKITRVLVDTRSGLADARVLDESHLGAGGSMLEDVILDAITFLKRTLVPKDRLRFRREGGSKGECTQGKARCYMKERAHDERITTN